MFPNTCLEGEAGKKCAEDPRTRSIGAPWSRSSSSHRRYDNRFAEATALGRQREGPDSFR
jgi:hypothetical protein